MELVGYLSPSAKRAFSSVRLRRHKTPRSIYRSFLKPMMDSFGENNLDEVLLNGNVTTKQVLDGMKQCGVWGYCDMPTKVVHIWWDGQDRKQVIAVLGHELEHLVWSDFRRQRVRGIELEERRCDLSGMIAVKTLELLLELEKS